MDLIDRKLVCFSQTNLMQTDLSIAVRGVTKIFHMATMGRIGNIFHLNSGGGKVVALNDVSLSIQQGEIFGLVGRNGQGKTTLIKCIASLLQPTHGSVSVFGFDTCRDGGAVRGMIGLVTADERTFYGRLNGWQNLLFFARLYGLSDVRARRRILDLAELLEFRPLLTRRFQELSSGNKQRMALIRALLIDPPVILLDEPTRSLDPIAADDLRRIIRQELNQGQGKTIFITSHNLMEVENLCSRIGFLSAGAIKLCATMEELAKQYFTIEHVTLDVRGISALNGLAHAASPLPPLEWRQVSPDLASISFRRQVGDDVINLVIRAILTHGGAIVGCRTERDGLRQIMNAIEENERNTTNAAVADSI